MSGTNGASRIHCPAWDCMLVGVFMPQLGQKGSSKYSINFEASGPQPFSSLCTPQAILAIPMPDCTDECTTMQHNCFEKFGQICKDIPGSFSCI